MARVTVTELGCPGHLVVANRCAWRRHTQVGSSFRVSTVGNYFPGRGAERDTIGSGPNDFFETMVFRTQDAPEPESDGCGCLVVTDYSGLDQARYATAGEAQAGHERYVTKYRRLAGREKGAA